MSEAEGSGTQPAGRDPQTIDDLFTRLLRSASLRSQVDSLTISPELDELPTDIQSYEALGNLLLRAVNGKADLPAQKVTVQYLKNDQKLRIPAALGMNAIAPANARCKQNATLIDRYKKASLLNYQQLREIVEGAKIAGDVQKAIDDIPAPAAFTGWKLDDDFYQSGIRPDDLDGFQDVVFATISIRLQFNCDIRDLGMLTRADSNVSDSAWKDISAVGVDRLICKLHPFSLQSIAALNLNAVAREPLAAYVRSYGLGIGILPSSDSVSMVEYTEEVARHVKRMKPAVYGYVMVNHRDNNGNADGLALAFSLKNVERDARGVAAKWERLWEQYLSDCCFC